MVQFVAPTGLRQRLPDTVIRDHPSLLINRRQQWILYLLTVGLLISHIPLTPNPTPLVVAIVLGCIYIVALDVFPIDMEQLLNKKWVLLCVAQAWIFAITWLLYFYEDTRSLWIIYLPALLIITFYAHGYWYTFLVSEVAVAAALGHLWELRYENLSTLQKFFETAERGLAIALPAVLVSYLVRTVEYQNEQLRDYADQLRLLHDVSYEFQTNTEHQQDERKLWELIAEKAHAVLNASAVLLYPLTHHVLLDDTVDVFGEPLTAGDPGVFTHSAASRDVAAVLRNVRLTRQSYYSPLNHEEFARPSGSRKTWWQMIFRHANTPVSVTAQKFQTATYAVIPLCSITDNRLIGVLWLGYSGHQYLNHQAKKLIEVFVEQAEAAIVVCRSTRREERHRLQIALHDSVKSSARGLLLLIDQAVDALPGDIEKLRRGLHEVRRATWQIFADTSLILDSITPDEPSAKSLSQLIHENLARLSEQNRSTVVLDIADDLPLPRMTLASSLLALLREGVINALEHSQATQIRVSVQRNGDALQIEIQDNGRGFDTEAPVGEGHLGLSIMRKRAQKLGGVCAIWSQPGVGTTVSATIPQI